MSKEIKNEPTKEELTSIEGELESIEMANLKVDLSHLDYKEGIEHIDICRLYLNEICKYKVLSKEEEQILGTKLKLKDKSKIMKTIKTTTKDSKTSEIQLVDFEKVFSSITKENIQQVLKIFNDYFQRTTSKLSSEKQILEYYLNEYNNLIHKKIPTMAQLNSHFQKEHKYNYFKNFSKDKALKSDELIEQLKEYIEYKLARETLINHNLKLVIPFAKYPKNIGVLQFLDLIEAGNIGIIKAVDRFEVDKGFKFSTYASWWIKQVMNNEIYDNSRTRRIPVHQWENINKVHKFMGNFYIQYGRYPNNQEIITQFNFNEQQLKEILSTMKTSQLSLEQSLLDDDGKESYALENFVPDQSHLEYNRIEDKEEIETLLEIMNQKLTEQEKNILLLRNGLSTLPGEEVARRYTLEEIGVYYNRTKESIRLYEKKALEKLRNNPKVKKLKG